MKQQAIDIFIVIACTIIAIILVFTVPADNVALRILTLPLVIVLPGYALISALFAHRAAGLIERLVMSLGVSMIIVILGGLILNLTPSGLRSGSWAVLLAGITVAASIVALVRRQGQKRAALQPSGSSGVGLTFPQGLLLGLAAIIVGGALAVSIIGAEQQPYPGFTQLWMLPASGANAKNSVLLGVKNMEQTAVDYRLVVKIGSTTIKQWPALDLRSGENWEATLAVPEAQHATNPTRVEALLYRLNAPTTLYRHVELWLST